MSEQEQKKPMEIVNWSIDDGKVQAWHECAEDTPGCNYSNYHKRHFVEVTGKPKVLALVEMSAYWLIVCEGGKEFKAYEADTYTPPPNARRHKKFVTASWLAFAPGKKPMLLVRSGKICRVARFSAQIEGCSKGKFQTVPKPL